MRSIGKFDSAWYIVSFDLKPDGSSTLLPFFKSGVLPVDTKSVLPPDGAWFDQAYGRHPAPKSVSKMLAPAFDASPESR